MKFWTQLKKPIKMKLILDGKEKFEVVFGDKQIVFLPKVEGDNTSIKIISPDRNSWIVIDMDRLELLQREIL